MKLVKYPYQNADFFTYNLKVETGKWKSGDFGLAADVWMDREHMWSTYDNGESPLDWVERHFPEHRAPDLSQSYWGLKGYVGYIGDYAIPTWDSLSSGMTMNEVVCVLQGLLATAQMTPEPNVKDTVPTATSITQKLYVQQTNFVPVEIIDLPARVAIRAIVGRVARTKTEKATYRAEFRSNGGVETVMFEANSIPLDGTAQRRQVTQAAKREVGLNGVHSVVVSSDEGAYRFVCPVKEVECEVTRIYTPKPFTRPTGGF